MCRQKAQTVKRVSAPPASNKPCRCCCTRPWLSLVVRYLKVEAYIYAKLCVLCHSLKAGVAALPFSIPRRNCPMDAARNSGTYAHARFHCGAYGDGFTRLYPRPKHNPDLIACMHVSCLCMCVCVCVCVCVCMQVVVQAKVRDFLPSFGSCPNRWQLDYTDGPSTFTHGDRAFSSEFDAHSRTDGGIAPAKPLADSLQALRSTFSRRTCTAYSPPSPDAGEIG